MEFNVYRNLQADVLVERRGEYEKERLPLSQEIRPPGDSPPSQKGGDIPRIFAPPPRGESPRNIAPL